MFFHLSSNVSMCIMWKKRLCNSFNKNPSFVTLEWDVVTLNVLSLTEYFFFHTLNVIKMAVERSKVLKIHNLFIFFTEYLLKIKMILNNHRNLLNFSILMKEQLSKVRKNQIIYFWE